MVDFGRSAIIGLSRSMFLLLILAAIWNLPLLVDARVTLIDNQTGRVVFNVSAPRITRFGQDKSNTSLLNGTLVLQNSTSSASGSVAFVFPTTGKTWENLIIPLYRQGAVAVVVYNRFATTSSGRIQIVRDGQDVSAINIPVFEIPYISGEETLKLLAAAEKENGSTRYSVIMTCCDPNPWLEAYSWYAPFWAVLNGVWTIANLIIIGHRLHLYRTVTGGFFPLTVGPVVFSIDIVRSIVQLIAVTPDPYFTTGNLTFAAGSVLLLLPLCLGIMSVLLISLYWAEVMTEKTAHVSTFLKRFKIPFIAICLLILALEITGSSFRASFSELTFMTFLTQVVYLLLCLAGISIYLFSGRLILNRLQSSAGHSGRTLRLIRTTKLLILSAFGVLISTICLVLPLIPQVYNTIYGFPAVFGVGQVGTNLACTFRALAFGASLKQAKEARKSSISQSSGLRAEPPASASGLSETSFSATTS